MSKKGTRDAVNETVRLFGSVAEGCEIIIDQAKRMPAIVDAYQPLLPGLKRLQSLLEEAIATLDRQPPVGREG